MISKRELAQSYWDAEISRDLDAVMAHYHPDASFVAPGCSLNGHEEIRGFYEDAAVLYPQLEVEIVSEITSGAESSFEWVAVLITPDGVRYPLRGNNCIRVRDGKFASVHSFFDTAELVPGQFDGA